MTIIDLSIRPSRRADSTSLAGILDRAWHHGHPYAPRSIDATVFDRETKDELVLVAESEREGALGFVSIYEPGSFIHHLYVDPSAHGRGIGRALLARAVAVAGGRATLKCQALNRDAFAFYRRLGWIEVAAGSGEYGAWIALRSPG